MSDKAARRRIEGDAKGQFAPKVHGGDNDGVDSAKPEVIEGDEDASFETDPEDRSAGKGRDRDKPARPF